MLCYKDKTFCPFYLECKDGVDCHRKLTQEIIIEAEDFGLGVARYCERPDCFKEKAVNELEINPPKLNNKIMFKLTQKSLQNNTTLDEEVSNYLDSNKS